MEAVVFLITSLITFLAGVLGHDLTNIKIRKYLLHSRKIKKNMNFVLLSDLHGRSFGEDNEKLIEKIDKLEPDMIIMAGDIMTAKDPFFSIERSVDRTESLIRRLSEKYPVYFGPGNHEERIKWEQWKYSFKYEEMMRRFKEAGAVILNNGSIMLDEYGIRISCLCMPEKFYKKGSKGLHESDMVRMLGKASGDAYQMLIAHDPEYIPTYAGWGADLSMSGHYHGGLVRLPLFGGLISPKLEIFPKYCGGVYHKGGKRQIVSCGLGTHTYPLRIFNPAELIYVKMEKEQSDGITG